MGVVPHVSTKFWITFKDNIMNIRNTAFAGSFYPARANEIDKLIDEIHQQEKDNIKTELAEKNMIGAVVPHAGYIYSGPQAVHFFEILKTSKKKYDTFIIINPNHTGYGAQISLDKNDFWDSPFGKVAIDKDFYKLLDFSLSSEAHAHEHSGEVMLPMLQHFLDYEFQILPITFSRQNYFNAKKIALALDEANQKLKKEILIIASSDFSHHLSPDRGYKMDQMVVDKILEKDPAGVYETVSKNNISVCGFGPIMALMEFARRKNEAYNIEILKRGHSGEVHPSSQVVDYISMLFYQ